MLFLTKRLLLSGNPLDCVCENYWIKSRLLEEADGQDLTCTDDRGASQAFITLTPPDCGVWSTALIPSFRRVKDLEADLEADLEPFLVVRVLQWFPKWWCPQTR